jgi:transcriptional regulator with XRE-family HTH domain
MEPLSEWFGERLRELRAGAGWTQQQLADRSGLSHRAITQWERGEREPGWSSILAICKALGVECTAFTKPPAEREPTRMGRPPKPKEEAEPDKPKRPRGRPRKGAG